MTERGRQSRQPNILLIQTDQHRHDGFGLAGNDTLATPAIDRLGTQGVVFDRAYVQSPLCTPSRASLFTGQYPRGHGAWTNGVPLPECSETLASVLRGAGYRTASVGKLHLTPYNMSPYPDGFDGTIPFPESLSHWAEMRDRFDRPYFGIESALLTLGHNKPAGHYGDWLAQTHPEALGLFGPEAALRPPTGAMQSWCSGLPVECHSSTWIGDTAAHRLRRLARDDDPFFLWVSFPDPHHPFAPPEPYASMYDPADVPPPARRTAELDDKPEHFREFAAGGVMHDGAYPEDRPGAVTGAQAREIIAHSYGMISLVDHNIGKLLDVLDQLGVSEHTIVIFTSDHGELLGDHGLMLKGPFMYESLIRVPFIMRYPREIPTARTDALLAHVDVLPTLADFIGLPAGHYPGRTLAPFLRQEVTRPPRETVLSEYGSGYWPGLNLKTLITPRWKLTMYPSGAGELYDLVEDPDEYTNRYRDPVYESIRRDLMARLIGELVETEPRPVSKHAHA